MDRRSLSIRLAETIQVYLPLGFISFGGPVAHIGMFHQLFIDKLHWLNEKTFAEFFGICQALPGPASTQMAFVIAMYRNGIVAAMVAFFLWSIPGLIIMTSLAIGMAFVPSDLPLWAHYLQNGLASCAIGISALAAYRLTTKVLSTHTESILCWITACASILHQDQWFPPLLILLGCIIPVAVHKFEQWRSKPKAYAPLEEVGMSPTNAVASPLGETDEPDAPAQSSNDSLVPGTDTHAKYFCTLRQGVAILVAIGITLAFSFLVKEVFPREGGFLLLQVFCVFFITGTIIFGGGPVVVPLLYSYVVDPGWVTDKEFITGLAVIAIIPGPNFNFSAYCGGLALRTFAGDGSAGLKVLSIILGALMGYVGIFLPGLTVKVGVLPLWKKAQRYPSFNIALKGVSAAAIGLVWSAVYLLSKNAIKSHNTACSSSGFLEEPLYVVICLTTIVAMGHYKLQPILTIAFGAASSLILYAVHRS